MPDDFAHIPPRPEPRIIAAAALHRSAGLPSGMVVSGMGHPGDAFSVVLQGGHINTHYHMIAADVVALRDFLDGLLRDATAQG